MTRDFWNALIISIANVLLNLHQQVFCSRELDFFPVNNLYNFCIFFINIFFIIGLYLLPGSSPLELGVTTLSLNSKI